MSSFMQSDRRSLWLGIGIASAVLLTSSALCLTYWPEDYTPTLLNEIYLHSVCSESDLKLITQLQKYRAANKILTEEVRVLENRFSQLLKTTEGNVPKSADEEHFKDYASLKKELLEYSNDIDHIYAKLDALSINSADLRQRRKQIIDGFAQDTKRIDEMLNQLKGIHL